MDFSTMTNKAVISWLTELVKNDEEITLDLLKEILDSRSVVDPVAGTDAVTIFYSGEPDSIINEIAATDNPNIRLIRRTEAFELLAYKDEITKINFDDFVWYAIKKENPSLTEDELKKARIDMMYGVSEAGTDASVIGKGFWTQISARFAADTKGEAYSLCSNAREDRIFSRDELKNWLANANDDAKMGGYTKAELLAMDESERFLAVQKWTIEDQKSTIVYFDKEDGYKVGQTFSGSYLESLNVSDVLPSGAVYNTDLYTWASFAKDDDSSVKALFGKSMFESLSKIEKIMANEIEVWTRKLPDVSDFNLSPDILKAYISGKWDLEDLKNAEIYFDEKGNAIGQSFKGTALEGYVKEIMPSEFTYKIKYDIYSKFTDDVTTLNYLKSSEKTLKELNTVDKEPINNIEEQHSIKTVSQDLIKELDFSIEEEKKPEDKKTGISMNDWKEAIKKEKGQKDVNQDVQHEKNKNEHDR